MATERISYNTSAPSTEFILYADRVSQSSSDMTTTVRIYLRAYNRGSTGTYSGYSGSQKASIDDHWSGAAHTGEPFLPSGVGTDDRRWEDGPWNVKIPHGSDGKRGPVTLRMRVKFGSFDSDKTYSFNDFPDIGDVPTAPTKPTLDNLTGHSVTVSWTGAKSNGSDIDYWDIQWSRNSDMSSPTWGKTYADNGYYNATGLSRKTAYFVRVRAHNKLGNGDWSDIKSFTTPADVPGPTNPWQISANDPSSINYKFNGPNDNGGASIQEYQVGYGTDPNNVQNILGWQNGDTNIGGLNRKTQYFVWSRARNEAGWGPWSARWDTWTGAYTPAQPTPLNIWQNGQTGLHYQFQGADDGGAPVQEWQVGYGTDPNNVQNILGWQGGDVWIGGLTPATTYYVWSRGRNEAGWGAWSARYSIRTLAGAQILVNGVWREAVPYVKVDGTWRVVLPYVKRIGLWKQTVV